jgi:hypothetical protein
MINNAKLGVGWKLVEILNTKETFLLRQFDLKSRETYWLHVEAGTGARAPLKLKRKHSDGPGAYCSQSQEFIFVDKDNIRALDLQNGKESLLYESGIGAYDICTSPDGKTICYLRNESVSLPESLRIERESRGLSMTVAGKESTLFRLDRAMRKSVEIARITGLALSRDIDWSKNYFYTNDREMKLLKINISTGATISLRCFREPMGVTAMRNGDLLVWSFLDNGISRLTLPEGESQITTFGRAAACSPDGTRIAFNQRSRNYLWLKEGGGDPFPIINFLDPGMSSVPAWCLCGDHLAVEFSSSRDNMAGGGETVFLIADVRKKELLALTDLRLAVHGDPVWLPRGLSIRKK